MLFFFARCCDFFVFFPLVRCFSLAQTLFLVPRRYSYIRLTRKSLIVGEKLFPSAIDDSPEIGSVRENRQDSLVFNFENHFRSVVQACTPQIYTSIEFEFLASAAAFCSEMCEVLTTMMSSDSERARSSSFFANGILTYNAQ